MFQGIDIFVLLGGVAIFFARIVDVSLGTFRTISIVHGQKWLAFWLGFFEILVWLTVISTVLHKIREIPLLGVFYALGFAAGNLVGIKLESWLALGNITLRVISTKDTKEMTERIRRAGYAVTTFKGLGKEGPIVELYIICRRRNLKELLTIVHEVEPNAFYTADHVATSSRVYGPVFQPVTGWRTILKKK